MNASIFIKTCSKDLEWLNFCLKSIRKFGSGFSGVVIAADDDCQGLIEKITENERIVFCGMHHNGYIQQQLVKLRAAGYLPESEAVLFVDSDVVFYDRFSPESFMANGKPFLMKTQYGDLGGAEAWKPITEKFVGFQVNYEYMRRMPLMYRVSSLESFCRVYGNRLKSLEEMTTRDFSEFNALGAFIEKHESHLYEIIDTSVSIPPAVAKQYWSWGGISDEIRSEIEGFLK